jgi:hypothetical protein
MNHTYEVFVDIKEYNQPVDIIGQILETRYEIDADSKLKAYGSALVQAASDHPKATEYCARVTRLLC